ncbi:hypothetical protein TBLA_0C07240 [Henningerozyma blattae CBS 6284]|uniref:Uncharacterized protein n=1 Tax=Henningerozyma blattae (strain ATCC 34711 / CBS 6284 / DSM 70876 / NBRC 10599 / NRRL Y-10934 / UCD 77-7) TaxID=1071380 RepID=I2H2B3_HENB6|nr:hypothetical protein TBLA_0C07240 [Tetrapisispora blattae CBS 6284]CCH60515.1 hypothetical protein TBLA_0C07240 [Tetrapisispora blattae CBS 6284]
MSKNLSNKESVELHEFTLEDGNPHSLPSSDPHIIMDDEFLFETPNKSLSHQSPTNTCARISHALRRMANVKNPLMKKFLHFKGPIAILLLFSVILGISVHPHKSIPTAKNYILQTFKSVKEVSSKRELAALDLTSSIKYNNNLEKSAINSRIINQHYDDFKIKGYISNLNIDKLLNEKQSKVEKAGSTLKDSNGELVAVKDFELMLNNDYSSLASCEDLEYSSKISYSTERKIIEDDLLALRRELINRNDLISKFMTNEDEKDLSDEEIVKKRWFRFGSSSVWLESQQCYITVTRLMYAKSGDRNKPDISLIRAQAFDKDWNEIKGKRIPKIDISLPKSIEEELQRIDKEFGNVDACEELSSDAVAYDQCTIQHANAYLDGQARKEEFLKQYFVTYPTVYEIPFYTEIRYKGPEDPRIILRKDDDLEEPVIVFNMENERGRRFYSYLPHRNIKPLVEFDIKGHRARKKEKNWAPFFHEDDTKTISLLSRGFIHFVYSFSPFEVIKCSLNDGMCEKVFQKESLKLSNKNNYGGMRGGTQIVQLPSIIPKVTGKQMWLGIAKSHIEYCGCGRHFYRPMLSLFVESNGVYHQELVVPYLDFNTEVIGWNNQENKCDYINIMSPNSISAWEVLGQDPLTKKFDDYLVITYSESDILSKVITVRGMLDYILRLYGEKDIEEILFLHWILTTF